MDNCVSNIPLPVWDVGTSPFPAGDGRAWINKSPEALFDWNDGFGQPIFPVSTRHRETIAIPQYGVNYGG